jgi:hypothetical protein
MNIEMTVAISIFIGFVAVMIAFAINYFSQAPFWGEIARYREKAISFIETISSKGWPEKWEEQNITPAQLGLSIDLYSVKVSVKEKSGYSRINEPVSVFVEFDPYCENKSWNNTVRVYDESFNEIPSFISYENFCSSQYLKEALITFFVNISANQEKNFQIFYSNDNTIIAPNYTKANLIAYWNFDEGSGTLAKDYSGNEKTGTLYNGSIICSGGDCPNWVDGKFGKALKFDGSNDYVRVTPFSISEAKSIAYWKKNVTDLAWHHIVNSSGTIYVDGSQASEKIFISFTSSELIIGNSSDGVYYNGTLDEIRIYNRALSTDEIITLNNSSPLSVKTFPAQEISAISQKKLQALRNLTYENLREALGEEYKFRIEIKPE